MSQRHVAQDVCACACMPVLQLLFTEISRICVYLETFVSLILVWFRIIASK